MSLASLHFNTETSLVLLYCITCVALLFALSLQLPYKAKKPINDLINKSLYYLGMAALLPLWTFLNSIRNLNRFATEARDPAFSPLMADKQRGRIIKMQRNVILSGMAVVLFVLLHRFTKITSLTDDKTHNLKNQVKNGSPQQKEDGIAAGMESKKAK